MDARVGGQKKISEMTQITNALKFGWGCGVSFTFMGAFTQMWLSNSV